MDTHEVFGTATFEQMGNALLKPIIEVKEYEGLVAKCLDAKEAKVIEPKLHELKIKKIMSTGKAAPKGFPDVTIAQVFEVDAKINIGSVQDAVARVQDRMRQKIEYEEDAFFLNIATKAAGEAEATLEFNDEFRALAQQYKTVFISRTHVAGMINAKELNVDPVNQRELIMAGYLGSFGPTDIVCTAASSTYELLAYPHIMLINKLSIPGELGFMRVVKPLTATPIVHEEMAAWEVTEELVYGISAAEENFATVTIQDQ